MRTHTIFLALAVMMAVIVPSRAEDAPDEAARRRLAAQQYLKQYPEADANGDGELTWQEFTSHSARRHKREALASLGEGARVVDDIEFASPDGHPLKIDLYLPSNPAGKPPLVAWIHGGGWRGGTKSRCLLTWLVAEGYAVASVEYRLTDKAVFPAQLHDCKGAIRWLRAHAGEYGYDAQRIAVAGESAGGHLAALIGTSGGVTELEGETGGNLDQSGRVRAVVNFYGPSDFIVYLSNNSSNPQAFSHLFGKPWPQSRSIAQLASPASHVGEGDAPMLIIQGTADTLVPPAQSEHLHKRYQQAGLVSQLVMIDGAGHTGPQFTDAVRRRQIRSFLDEHLKGTRSEDRP